MSLLLFFFNDTATTEIYTLSLHDALPIWSLWCIDWSPNERSKPRPRFQILTRRRCFTLRDRKSTRLNSSHVEISYAVFCLKKKIESRERIAYFKLYNKQHPHVRLIFNTDF